MGTYSARVEWKRGDDAFLSQQYSRGHRWHFDEGTTVPASASPHIVKAPWAVGAAVDPEEAMVAALSSCHMLFFLSFASRAGFTVDSYDDAAQGVMERGADGKEWMTHFTLRPVVTFRERAPSEEEFLDIHHAAHDACYIANSVKGVVHCEPTSRLA